MHQLLEKMVVPAFDNPHLDQRHDGAQLDMGGSRIAFTTDSYVVNPMFFPGGDIGCMAIYGTVNDLAMCGARPQYLSAGLIIEEGLPTETLWRVVQSMQQAAQRAGVTLVTGDTKVVDRGKGDGLYINTAGVGLIESKQVISPRAVQPGDAIILSGDLGRHGIAIMAERESLAFESAIESDCAPLAGMVSALLETNLPIHCLRDLTRGGLASALVEISETASCRIAIDERLIPVGEEVRGACEILGLDPMYVANEGRMVLFVPEEHTAACLDVLHTHEDAVAACCIGRVEQEGDPLVTLQSTIGATRIVDMISGEQLPRIC